MFLLRQNLSFKQKIFRLDCHPDDDEGVESSRVRHLRFGATEAELGDGEDGCDAEATPEIGFSDLATRMLNMRSRVARSLNIQFISTLLARPS